MTQHLSSTLSRIHPRWGLCLALVLTAGIVRAQPQGTAIQLTAGYAFSSSSDLEREGDLGEVGIHRYGLELSTRQPVADGTQLLAGATWHYDSLDSTGPVPLPDNLEAFSLDLGVRTDLSDWLGTGWSAMAAVRPTWAGTNTSLSRSQLNTPALLSLQHQPSRSFGWSLGLAFNRKSDNDVLPVLGLNWSFSPDWTLFLGFPRTELQYRLNPEWTLRAGAGYQGGAYRIDDAPIPALDNSWLHYREIRLGAGFEWQPAPSLTLSLDAGVVVDRRFKYLDRDYRLEGDTAAFLSLSASTRF